MGSCLSRGSVAQNKVVPEFDNDKDYLGHRGYSRTLKSKDGANLFAYFWPADPDVPLKGIIQIAHGSAAYTCFDYLKFKAPGQPNLYDGSWVAAFNRAGFAVCGLDQQGSGRSRGANKAVKTFQSHVDNLLLLADHVAQQGDAAFPKDLPYFLVGHCVGGLAAALACLQQPQRFAGLVLLSPLLSPEPGKAAVKPAAKVSPSSDVDSCAEPPIPSWLTEAWDADPYVASSGDRQPPAEQLRPAAEQLSAPGGPEALALPLLIFTSERGTLTEPEGARKLHERAASADKTLRVLSQQWHVLTKEDGWEELLAETSAWLVQRTSNSGGLTRGLDGAGAKSGKENQPPPPATSGAAAAAAALQQPQQPQHPLLTRSMSMLERLPEHEPLMPRSPEQLRASGAGNGPTAPLPIRRYSFSGGRLPTAGGPGPLLGPLPPLGQRRSLGQLPPELAGYQLRGRLPPLPPLPPLMDKKPAG